MALDFSCDRCAAQALATGIAERWRRQRCGPRIGRGLSVKRAPIGRGRARQVARLKAALPLVGASGVYTAGMSGPQRRVLALGPAPLRCLWPVSSLSACRALRKALPSRGKSRRFFSTSTPIFCEPVVEFITRIAALRRSQIASIGALFFSVRPFASAALQLRLWRLPS